MENTDFVIEHIDEEVQVIADQPSVVTNYPANTDFFIENIDSNVISIAHSLNIEASEVDFRPANTDFFIENIDKNVIAIAESMNLSPSEVDFRPANTDFFVENIDKNLIEIAESLSLTPYEVTIRPANTDMFIENIDKNVTLIKGSTNVVTVSGEYININLPDGGKVQSAQIDGNATQTGTPTPDSPQPISTVTGENVVKVVGKNLFHFTESRTVTTGGVTFETTEGTSVLKINGTSTSSGNFSTTLISDASPLTLEAGTYTIKADGLNEITASTDYLYLGKVGIGASVYLNPNNNWQATFTLTAKTSLYMQGVFALSTAYDNKDVTIQLELGSTATTYEAYQGQEFEVNLGSLELAGIGEIQPDGLPKYHDSFKNIGGKWYIEKQVGKLVLDGTENWLARGTQYAGYFGVYTTTKHFGIDDNFLAPTNFISDHFKSGDGTYNATYGQNISSTQFAIYATIDSSITADVAAFKTWLSTHPTTVYYALATPTTTEITDQTLIDQLEALASATLGYGVNNIWTEIATGNAMPTLKLVIEKY